MASSFFSSILSKTSQVLGSVPGWAALPSSSSDPRSSVLKDLEELEKTLKRIQAVLHDAEEREIRDKAVKLWLKELKEVAYDAEDVLDDYVRGIPSPSGRGASRKRKRVEAGDDEEALKSIGGLYNLHSLEELEIFFCPQLRLLSEEGLPSTLQNLRQQLTSLSGMQHLASLTRLAIKVCPKLQIMVEDQLPSMPRDVEIIDCPGLVNWCEIQKINCIQVVSSGNKLTISNTWEKIMHGFDDLTSIKHLPFANSWHSLWDTFSISNSWRLFPKIHVVSILEELTIWGCTHIPPIRCLPEQTVLRSLVVKDCPGMQVVTDELLPRTLDSLVVDSCEDLRCLQLAQQNRDALKELQIVNCPKLIGCRHLP